MNQYKGEAIAPLCEDLSVPQGQNLLGASQVQKYRASVQAEAQLGSITVHAFSLYVHKADNPEQLKPETLAAMGNPKEGDAFVRCTLMNAPRKEIRAVFGMRAGELYHNTDIFVPCKGLTITQKVNEVIQAARQVQAEGHEVTLYVPEQPFDNQSKPDGTQPRVLPR